jgi:SAM-dependent methyltransferase
MKTTSSVFNTYSRYYDLLYQDKNYIAEVDYIQGLLTRQGIAQGSLLEFGSGTGIHGGMRAARGYHVHGIERSAEMLARAIVTEGFSCQKDDICEVRLGRTFDAVLALFHVISYQITNADLVAVFTTAREHLKPGGVFIFDFWFSPAVYSQQPSVRVKRIEGKQLEITRIAEPEIYPNENRVDVNYTIFARDLLSGAIEMTSETHPMRHLSLPEIDLIASVSGFERIITEEFLSGKPAGEDTWGACVTLKRI